VGTPWKDRVVNGRNWCEREVELTKRRKKKNGKGRHGKNTEGGRKGLRGGSVGGSRGHLGPSWAFLGPSWGRLGVVLDPLGDVLGASWGHLGRLGGLLGRLGGLSGCLGSSKTVLGASWAGSGLDFGTPLERNGPFGTEQNAPRARGGGAPVIDRLASWKPFLEGKVGRI